MPGRITATLLLLLLFAGTAQAAKEPIYKIRWQQRDNRILFETVCYDQGYGTIEYRQCRGQAQQYFRTQCERSREKVRRLGVRAGEADIARQHMFCDAASRFTPVR